MKRKDIPKLSSVAAHKPPKRRMNYVWFLVIAELVLVGMGFFLFYSNRIMPGVRVAGIHIGNHSRSRAEEKITQKIADFENEKLNISLENQVYTKSIKELGIQYLPKETVNEAYGVGRRNKIGDLWGFIKGTNINLAYKSGSELDDFLEELNKKVEIEAVEPRVEINQTKEQEIEILPGSDGQEIDLEQLRKDIDSAITKNGSSEIRAEIREVKVKLSEEERELNRVRAEKLSKGTVVLKLDLATWELDGETILGFMGFPSGYDEGKIGGWIDDLSNGVDREPQNALFNFSGGRVEAFQPAKDGVELDRNGLMRILSSKFDELEGGELRAEAQLPVRRTKPTVGNEDVNDLGIKELIGVGKSTFKGSIPNRIHNLSLASSRLNGVLIGPGETFSFNKTVGEISKATGYKEAYVIEKGRTVLGDGGGVCQVSTTLFRSAMNAGLPIEDRRAHAYRVGYYEQDSKPGLDATVFEPSVDFKFKNDTPAYVLIQTYVDKKNLAMTFELYGTSDGRVSNVSEPKITSQTPPPPDLYVDDPTIPNGTVKQIEHKAWGARVVFDYKVERGGEVLIEKTFVSNYRPWQAVFLKGTGV